MLSNDCVIAGVMQKKKKINKTADDSLNLACFYLTSRILHPTNPLVTRNWRILSNVVTFSPNSFDLSSSLAAAKQLEEK
jgi:hypothetical protein